jgi:hypothetical protein
VDGTPPDFRGPKTTGAAGAEGDKAFDPEEFAPAALPDLPVLKS